MMNRCERCNGRIQNKGSKLCNACEDDDLAAKYKQGRQKTDEIGNYEGDY
jgi:hypothetical protein